MRVGVTLPVFRERAEPALEVATRAEAAGLDGVFAFDHLWPLGQPERPALHGPTLLAAVAVETSRVSLGPLVARVSLVPNADLVEMVASLAALAGGRLIAGLGAGDAASRPENLAYGLDYPPLARRVADLGDCCRRLRAAGVRVWVGGHHPAVRRVAAAEADGWNGWDEHGSGVEGWAADAAEIAGWAGTRAGAAVDLTWGGQVLIGREEADAHAKLARFGTRPGLVQGTVDDLVRHLRALADVGAAWAVCAPLDIGSEPEVIEYLAEAAGRVR